MERCVLTVLLTVYVQGQTVDPCTTYKSLNDSTMLLSHMANTSCTIAVKTIDWYRFESSKEGLLATSCPTGTQCGTVKQVWMSGTPPIYNGGHKNVSVCVRMNNNCCARNQQIQVKNCNTYVVYKLARLPPCSKYCFNQSSAVLRPVSTTTKKTTLITSPNTTTNRPLVNSHVNPISTTTPANSINNSPNTTPMVSDETSRSKLNAASISGISVGVLVLIGLVIGLFYMKKAKYTKTRTEPSNTHWTRNNVNTTEASIPDTKHFIGNDTKTS